MGKITLWDFKGPQLCFSPYPHFSFERTMFLSTIQYSQIDRLDPPLALSERQLVQFLFSIIDSALQCWTVLNSQV
jgi:hypothetical protein